MSRVLEKNKNSMLLLLDDGTADLVPLTSYTRLRYEELDGKPISYRATDGSHEIAVEERNDGTFLCYLDGNSLTMQAPTAANADFLATALLAQRQTGSIESYVQLWKLLKLLDVLSLSLIVQPSWYPIAIQEGKFFQLPSTFGVQSVELSETPKEVMAKVVFKVSGEGDDSEEHLRVAILGRDESKKHWMHFAPPDYASRTVEECDLWLYGVDAGQKAVIIK